jgi:hypothetical protein
MKNSRMIPFLTGAFIVDSIAGGTVFLWMLFCSEILLRRDRKLGSWTWGVAAELFPSSWPTDGRPAE